MTEILYTNTEILSPTEVFYLIKDGKKKHKNSLRIKVRQVECGGNLQVAVFQRTQLDTIEDSLKYQNYSFRYETKPEPLPAEQSKYGGNTLLTTFLVIKLKKQS